MATLLLPAAAVATTTALYSIEPTTIPTGIVTTTYSARTFSTTTVATNAITTTGSAAASILSTAATPATRASCLPSAGTAVDASSEQFCYSETGSFFIEFIPSKILNLFFSLQCQSNINPVEDQAQAIVMSQVS